MLFSSILTDAGISFIVIIIGEGKRIQALRRFDFGERRRSGSGRDLESFLSYFRYAWVCVYVCVGLEMCHPKNIVIRFCFVCKPSHSIKINFPSIY